MLQQLGQYQAQQGRTLLNAQLANGVGGPAAQSGLRTQGVAGLGPLLQRQQPGTPGQPGAGLNLSAINAGGGLQGLQAYSNLQSTLPMSAALQSQQQQQRALNLGLSQLSAAGHVGLGGLQSRLQLGNAGAGLNLLQQGLPGTTQAGMNNPSQELLALLNKQRGVQSAGAGGAFGGVYGAGAPVGAGAPGPSLGGGLGQGLVGIGGEWCVAAALRGFMGVEQRRAGQWEGRGGTQQVMLLTAASHNSRHVGRSGAQRGVV
jgi:hypothetical protein